MKNRCLNHPHDILAQDQSKIPYPEAKLNEVNSSGGAVPEIIRKVQEAMAKLSLQMGELFKQVHFGVEQPDFITF